MSRRGNPYGNALAEPGYRMRQTKAAVGICLPQPLLFSGEKLIPELLAGCSYE